MKMATSEINADGGRGGVFGGSGADRSRIEDKLFVEDKSRTVSFRAIANTETVVSVLLFTQSRTKHISDSVIQAHH